MMWRAPFATSVPVGEYAGRPVRTIERIVLYRDGEAVFWFWDARDAQWPIEERRDFVTEARRYDPNISLLPTISWLNGDPA